MVDLYDQPPDDPRATPVRPCIGVYFECCGVYSRIYRRPEQMEYVGNCPRCLAKLRVKVRADGTSQRIFRATSGPRGR